VATTPLDELLCSVGLSAREVFARGGPPPMSLHRWKQGIKARPSTVRKLAGVLNVDFVTALDAVTQTVADARKRASLPFGPVGER